MERYEPESSKADGNTAFCRAETPTNKDFFMLLNRFIRINFNFYFFSNVVDLLCKYFSSKIPP